MNFSPAKFFYAHALHYNVVNATHAEDIRPAFRAKACIGTGCATPWQKTSLASPTSLNRAGPMLLAVQHFQMFFLSLLLHICQATTWPESADWFPRNQPHKVSIPT